MTKVLLSIIIPAYNAEPYIEHLMNRLKPQITEEIEVIVVDDGSKFPYIPPYNWITFHQFEQNRGVSAARNKGIDMAQGEYIAFIDADDLVSENYIKLVLDKIRSEHFDYCYLSWKTIGTAWDYRVQLRTINDKFPPFNLCVWNRIYKRSFIKNIRFNVLKRCAEDAEFIRKLHEDKGKKAFIPDIIYYYRSDTPNSITKRFGKGQIDGQRVVYYYSEITRDMEWLIEETKILDRTAEVMIMTYENNLPELEQHAMVIKPQPILATELRGEYTELVKLINKPIKTQVVLYTHWTDIIGGIETFIYNFCLCMKRHYDILVLYDTMHPAQIERLEPHVMVMRNDPTVTIECDTLIMNRVLDRIPDNVVYQKSIQILNGAKVKGYPFPKDRDLTLCVSNYVQQCWKDDDPDSIVIRNLVKVEEPKETPLLLVSATRIDTPDKGENRMITLARLLKKQGISYIWLCFTNRALPADAPAEMIRMEPTLDIIKYIKKADYLVQLSSSEGFCYSIVEALSVGTPIICTPLDVLDEIGVVDGENARVLPYDLNSHTSLRHLRDVPQFKYKYNNNPLIKKWKAVLGDTEPSHSYIMPERIAVKITSDYYSTRIDRLVRTGERLTINKDRAEVLISAGYAVKEE
jgi:glycosyltransferase involved in cell wall biosynthesis